MIDPESLLDDTHTKRTDNLTPEKRANLRLYLRLKKRRNTRKKREAAEIENAKAKAEIKHQKYNEYYRKYMKKWRAERKQKRIDEIRKKAAEESLLGNKY